MQLQRFVHRFVTLPNRQWAQNQAVRRSFRARTAFDRRDLTVTRATLIASLSVAAFGFALMAATPAALAQSSGKTGMFEAWGTYVHTANGKKTCYILTAPIPNSAQPASVDHGDNYFLVSQKPGENVAFEPQFIAGYNMQENGKVTVSVGDKSFSMFTRGKSAWMENAAEEPALIAAMRGGSSMKIAATSARGTATSYEFSLKGVTKALQQIQSCS
jgi:Invasion associated locus B (IalB) protein